MLVKHKFFKENDHFIDYTFLWAPYFTGEYSTMNIFFSYLNQSGSDISKNLVL